MGKTIVGKQLTHVDIAPDGKSVRLNMMDASDTGAALELPLECVNQLILTLPHVVTRAMRARDQNSSTHLVFPLDKLRLQRIAGDPRFMLTLKSTDGFEVSFAVEGSDIQYLKETVDIETKHGDPRLGLNWDAEPKQTVVTFSHRVRDRLGGTVQLPDPLAPRVGLPSSLRLDRCPCATVRATMDFELNPEQRALQQSAREFAARELAPHAKRWDAEEIFPREALTLAGELGFCGLYAGEAHGGLGLSRLDATLVIEELAAACTSTTAYLTIHNMATWMVTRWARPEIAVEWGPALTSGEALASYCLTEPGAGSDAAALSTSARLVGGDYVLNGAKAFISGAGVTDALVVMARTGGAGPRGISALLVPADRPGISFGRTEDKLGWHTQPTRAVVFEDVHVPASHLLGAEGEGFAIAMKGLDGGRINIAACSLGAAQASLDAARRYMHERRAFNTLLADFQALQFKVADMATALVSARHMVRLAASKLDAGSPQATVYCAMAKQLATDAGFRIVNEALQIHGGYGYLREFPLERFLRDTRVHQILEGTNEIMRVIVSRRVLDEGGEDIR
jgi:alkylation response protein AidB-like acyl-CoA dehydrogenase